MRRSGCFLLWIFGLPGLIQGLAPLNCAAALVCDEPVFDFGTVQSGARIEHVFRLKNTGSTDLKITDIDAPCDCTEVLATDRQLAPDEEIPFPVVLDLRGKTGPQNRRVFIRVNRELAPSLVLSMTGHAAEGMRIQPAVLVLRDDENRQSQWQGHVDVIAPDNKPFEVLKIDIDEQLWTVSTSNGSGPGRVQIHLQRKEAPPHGQEQTSVRIRTNHPELPHAEFQILTIAPTGLLFSPQMISLPEAMGCLANCSVLIRDPGGSELEVLHVELPQDGMKWDVTKSEHGLLQLQIEDIHPVESLNGQQLKVHFSGPGNRTIEIPFEISGPAEGT